MFWFNKRKKYISCDLIEHGVNFHSDSINFCCIIPPHFTGFKKLFPKYHGENIDWNIFFKIKRKYRNQMKQGKIMAECKDCFYLKEKEWDNDDYISFIDFNNWTVCNEHCIYCDLKDKQQPKQYDVYPIVKDLAEKGYLRKGGHITIAGGEPSVAKEFNDLLQLLLDKELEPIRVLTNATKYSPIIARGLAESKVNIVVSVDSGTRDTFIKVKRFDFYDEVWENIARYASVQAGTDKVKTKFILIPHINDSKDEIDLWLQKSISAGIKHVAYDIECTWFNRYQHNLPSNIFSITEYVLNKTKEYGLDIELIDRGRIIADILNNKTVLK